MARSKGSWTVWRDEYGSDDEFRDALRASLADVEAILFREGDGFIVASTRVHDDGAYYTAGVVFDKQFMPAARQRAAEAPQAPPEAVLADVELTPEELAEHFPEPEPVEAA